MRKLKIRLSFNSFLFLFSIFVFLYVFFILWNRKINTNYQEGDFCITGVVAEVHQNAYGYSFLLKGKEKVLVSSTIFSYQMADRIKVCGTFKIPNTNTNFHLFSYRNYLLSKQIVWQVSAKEVTLIKKDASFFYRIKRKIEEYLENYQSVSYLKTFVLGDQSSMSSIKETYQNLGISHLFSVSGMHIHFLTATLFFLLQKEEKKKRNDIIVLLFTFFYAWLTGFSPSVLRATCLFSFCILKKWFSFSLKNHTFLFLLFLLFLLINPYYLYNSGFLYSFVISFTLLYYQEELQKLTSFFKRLFLTSCIAFFITIPISLSFQFELVPFSIFYNLFFVPFVTYLLFPCCFLILLFPFLEFIFCFLISILETAALFFQNFNVTIDLGYPSYFLIFYVIASWIAIKAILFKKKIFFLPIFFCILFHFLFPYFDFNCYITMLDVGQGDSILIQLPHSTGVFLIDTGGSITQAETDTHTIGKNTLIPFFKMKGIRKIDYLILTHGDYDHMGEAKYLIENFKVEKVIFNCGPYNDLEQELIKVLDNKKIKYYSCIKELNIDNNKLYFLHTKEYDNENDNSNVIYTELNGYKFMFMGDAGIEKEKDILEKYNISNIDVLKVGHHGSKTSSDKNFINEINPKYSIISVGKNNRYGHPNKEVLNNLNNSKIYRTDQDGSIMFKIKNNKLKIKTCSP